MRQTALVVVNFDSKYCFDISFNQIILFISFHQTIAKREVLNFKT